MLILLEMGKQICFVSTFSYSFLVHFIQYLSFFFFLEVCAVEDKPSFSAGAVEFQFGCCSLLPNGAPAHDLDLNRDVGCKVAS